MPRPFGGACATTFLLALAASSLLGAGPLPAAARRHEGGCGLLRRCPEEEAAHRAGARRQWALAQLGAAQLVEPDRDADRSGYEDPASQDSQAPEKKMHSISTIRANRLLSVGTPPTAKGLLIFWAVALAMFLFSALLVHKIYRVFLPRVTEVGELKRSRASSADVAAEIVDSSLNAKWYGIKFQNPSAEERWLGYSETAKMSAGSRVLFLVTWSMMIFEVVRLVQAHSRSRRWQYVSIHVPAFFILCGVLWLTLSCWRQPRAWLYWSVLLFFYFYVPAISLPPMSSSCFDLALIANKCLKMGLNCLDEAVTHVDCSVQGHSSMQIIMTWLLLQPWLIPMLEHMQAVWIWILCIYAGWLVAYWFMTGMEVFGWVENSYRVFLLGLTLIVACVKKYSLEKSQRLKFLQGLQQKASSKKIFQVLMVMMPVHVIEPMMAQPGQPIADQVQRVSILFILIADFDQFTRRMTPRELLKLLNNQFTRFDEVCTANKVTKIETVGEEYVACVGVLPADKEENERCGHAPLLERLFIAAGEILQLQTEEVKFKMGVHSGPIVAGVIGTKLPRYRLFGDTINSAARMMQKGLPGQLQFGVETRSSLPQHLLEHVSLRGEVEMKGKGKVTAYTFQPSADFAASVRKNQNRAGEEDRESADQPPEGAEEELTDTDTRFEETLRQMTKQASAKKPLVLSQREGFTEEMERNWSKWFHETVICHKLVRRFGGEAILVLLVSGFELYYMLELRAWKRPHPFYSSRYRLAVFVYCRGCVLLMEMIWWYVAEASNWIQRNPGLAQTCILVTSCVGIMLIYISYDALIFSNTVAYREVSQFQEEFHVPPDQVFSLNFVLFVFLKMRRHAFRFFPTLVFLPLVLLVVFSPSIYELFCLLRPQSSWPDYESIFSFQGELLFITLALMQVIFAHEDEQASRARFKARLTVEETRKRTADILDTLMPPLVVQELAKLGPADSMPSDQYRHATIAQSDLCGFTQLSSTRKPAEVVQFMGDLFGAFDVLTDKHGVYKVETVGDAYIAGMAERPLTADNLPINVVLFGLDMVRAVDDWATKMGVEVTCRVGIHYGECIGGIVGTKMQRYHLFGDLLTGLEILESTAPEGRVQVSDACRQEVERQLREEHDSASAREEALSFTRREDPQLKTSKGETHDYSEVGGVTFLVQSNRALRRRGQKVQFA